MAALETFATTAETQVADFAGYIDQLLQGISEADGVTAVVTLLQGAVGKFRTLVAEVKALVDTLPSQVPAGPRQALQATVKRFLDDLDAGAGQAQDYLGFVTKLVETLQLPEQ